MGLEEDDIFVIQNFGISRGDERRDREGVFWDVEGLRTTGVVVLVGCVRGIEGGCG